MTISGAVPKQAVPKQKVHLAGVQETLLIPLWARAAQTKKRLGLIRDHKAVEVADAIDYDYRRFRGSLRTQIGCALRTLQLDAWVKEFLARHPSGTVVELGAGLNSRFERTDDGQARYIEIDLPDVIAVRRKFFDETDRRTLFAGSALDEDWIDVVARTGGPCMIVAEGLLMYLTEPQVRGLFATIARRLPGSLLAFDSVSTRGVRYQHMIPALRHMDARFGWGIDEPRRIEDWADGYACVESVNMRDIALRNRDVIPILLQLLLAGRALFRRTPVNDYWLSLFRLGPA
jgi:O-methyltransferase involved in polyketide biosynthesis